MRFVQIWGHQLVFVKRVCLRFHLNSQTAAQKTNPNKALFCDTCTRNQSLALYILSAYLPDENVRNHAFLKILTYKDPSYQELLSGYSAYKEDLETRYPPVCSLCEPQVNAKLSVLNRTLRAALPSYKVDMDPLQVKISHSRRSCVSFLQFLAFLGALVAIMSYVNIDYLDQLSHSHGRYAIPAFLLIVCAAASTHLTF